MNRKCQRLGPFGKECDTLFCALVTIGKQGGEVKIQSWVIAFQQRAPHDRLVHAHDPNRFFIFHQYLTVLTFVAAETNQGLEEQYVFLDDCDEEDPTVPAWILEGLQEISSLTTH